MARQGHAEGRRVWWARMGPRRGPNYGAAWPSSKFSESRKKRVVLAAEVGRAEQANDERAGLVQGAGTMEADADVVQMIGAAGAPSRVTAERRLKDNGLTAVRRPLPPPPDSDIASIVFGSDNGPHADGAAGSSPLAQPSTRGARSLHGGSPMDMSRRSTNHLTAEQLYGSETSGVPPCDPRDFEAAHGISSRAISENLAASLDITRRPLAVRQRSHTDPRDVAGTPHDGARLTRCPPSPLAPHRALTDIYTYSDTHMHASPAGAAGAAGSAGSSPPLSRGGSVDTIQQRRRVVAPYEGQSGNAWLGGEGGGEVEDRGVQGGGEDEGGRGAGCTSALLHRQRGHTAQQGLLRLGGPKPQPLLAHFEGSAGARPIGASHIMLMAGPTTCFIASSWGFPSLGRWARG